MVPTTIMHCSFRPKIFVYLAFASLLLYIKNTSGADSKTYLMRNMYCYLSCGSHHTACKRAPCDLNNRLCGKKGTQYPLTRDEKIMVTDQINNFRESYATSKNASDMHVFRYNEELEFIAQCWANQCEINRPETCRSTEFWDNVGQTIYISKSTTHKMKLLSNALKVWKSSIINLTDDLINSYTPSSGVNNVAQLLWAENRFIGCGRVNFYVWQVIICNYGPGGAIAKKPMYTRGVPCASCTDRCSSRFRGLCGLTCKPQHWISPLYTIEPSGGYAISIVVLNNLIMFVLVLYM